jgi:hypothetical protein
LDGKLEKALANVRALERKTKAGERDPQGLRHAEPLSNRSAIARGAAEHTIP